MKSILIYGLHAVRQALLRHPEAVLEVYVSASREARAEQDMFAEVLALAEAHGLGVQAIRDDRLQQLLGANEHQGVAARRRPYAAPSLEMLLALERERPPLFLVLDQVQDPHNLGAALRVADGAGVDALIVPSRRAAHITPVVAKVACGAAETVPVVEVGNLAQSLRMLKDAGLWLIGLDGEAQDNLYAQDLTGPVALVLGNEGDGLRQLTREHCDFLLRIPMLGVVESLNVSTATAVCLFEALRQRGAGR